MIQEPLAFEKRISVDRFSDHSTLPGKWQTSKVFVGCFDTGPTQGNPLPNSTNVPTAYTELGRLNEKLANLISEQVENLSHSIDYLLRELIRQIYQNLSPTTRAFECQDIFSFAVHAQQQLAAPFSWWSSETSADTTRNRVQDDLVDSLESLFCEASSESFEDGMDSTLSLDLERMLQEHGLEAVRAIGYYIVTKKTKPEITAEVLKLLGRVDQPTTKKMRRWILERELFNVSPSVRDAAGLAISSMNDPLSIRALEDAISREKHELLKLGFLKVLTKLRKS